MNFSETYSTLKEEFINLIKGRRECTDCKVSNSIIEPNLTTIRFTYHNQTIQLDFWRSDYKFQFIAWCGVNKYSTPRLTPLEVKELVFERVDLFLSEVVGISNAFPEISNARRLLVDKLFNSNCSYYPSSGYQMCEVDLMGSKALELLHIQRGIENYVITVNLTYIPEEFSARLTYKVYSKSDCSPSWDCSGEVENVTLQSLNEKIEELQVELFRNLSNMTKHYRLISMEDLFYAIY